MLMQVIEHVTKILVKKKIIIAKKFVNRKITMEEILAIGVEEKLN
jgi:hypothetical protein